jgi:hypothetical protein
MSSTIHDTTPLYKANLRLSIWYKKILQASNPVIFHGAKPQGGMPKIRGLGWDGSQVLPCILGISLPWSFTHCKVLGGWSFPVLMIIQLYYICFPVYQFKTDIESKPSWESIQNLVQKHWWKYFFGQSGWSE